MLESLELLLQRIVAAPESSLSHLLRAVDKAGEERKLSREHEREQSNRLKLSSVRRKAVSSVKEESAV
jgi:hypothetical protein